MGSDLMDMLVKMIKDLEDTREKYHGYAYIRTMRNILVGKDNAIIAQHFKAKPYYSLFHKLALENTERMMDTLVHMNKIDIVWTDHGKLYCTPEYHNYLCARA